jgi:hypothetical protein
MDDDNESKKYSPFFQVNDVYEQAEELQLRLKIPAQRKLILNVQGLGLHLSTGTQEPTESRCVKLTPKVVEHTFGPLTQYKFRRTLAMNSKKEDQTEEEVAMRETKEPRTWNENEILIPPFIVDLLTGILGGGKQRVDRLQTYLQSGLASFKHAQLNKEEQLSMWTRMHWERWPPLCLETSPRESEPQKNVAENIDLWA